MNSDTRVRRLDAPRALAALATLPFLLVATLVARFHANVPVGDQWTFVPTLRKALEGGTWLPDLLEHHNGHSLLFPELIMVGLARATAWDLRAEVATSVALALGTFLVLHAILRRAASSARVHPLAPAVSLAVFSLAQHQNWLLGWQLQIFLSVFATAAGILVLAPGPTWPRVAGASALGIVATHSFGNGVMFWPAASLVLVAHPEGRRGKAAAFAAVAALVAGHFAASFDGGSSGSEPLSLARGLAYVLEYLGASLVTFSRPGALVAGALGLAGTGALAAWLVRRRLATFLELAPLLALALYAFLGAAVTAWGRAATGGPSQAMSSRYTTISVLFWVAALGLLREAIAREPRLRRPAGAALVAVIALLVVGEVRETGTYVLDARKLERAEEALLDGTDPELVRHHIVWGLVGDRELAESLRYLREQRLCRFGYRAGISKL